LVNDGDRVQPGTWLLGRTTWLREIRALLPPDIDATVHFNTTPFPEDFVAVELRTADGRALRTSWIPATARREVSEGATVSRGTLLAAAYLPVEDELHHGDARALRAFLNASRQRRKRAKLAPFEGCVATIEDRYLTLRDDAGRSCRVRRSQRQRFIAQEGDRVRCGDALTSGERSHHQLLRLWGPARLAEHMLSELENELSRRELQIPPMLLSLVVREMLAWRRVLSPGHTGLERHQVLSRTAFERVQRATRERGGQLATAAPMLRGYRAMARRPIR
jgi:hypothetical protein